MRLLISNSLIIDIIIIIVIIIITVLLASSLLSADYVEIRKHLTAFKYRLSMLKCVCVWCFILIFSIGAFSERSAGGVTRDVEGTPKCTQPKCIKTP